jgi:hypothetical protein
MDAEHEIEIIFDHVSSCEAAWTAIQSSLGGTEVALEGEKGDAEEKVTVVGEADGEIGEQQLRRALREYELTLEAQKTVRWELERDLREAQTESFCLEQKVCHQPFDPSTIPTRSSTPFSSPSPLRRA